jgi:hypothetical protein
MQPDRRATAAEPLRQPQPPLRAVGSAVPVAGRACACGHGKQAHEHYRRGTDCALCLCGKFSRPLLRRLFSA